MSTNTVFSLEQNESYAVIHWKLIELLQSNVEELENLIRFLFKKEYSNIILNINLVTEMDGFGVSVIRKGTRICSNELGLFAVVTKNDEIQDKLDLAKIENFILLNTIQEAIDAIYLNDLENDFQDGDDESDEFSADSSEFQEEY